MKKPANLYPLYRPTWAQVDLRAVAANYRRLKRLAGPRTELLPVVKGDAYGHGMLQVAAVLDALGAKFFGVSDVEEGIILRQSGFRQTTLLFESTLPTDAPLIAEYDLTPTICTFELADALNAHARSVDWVIDVHVEIDTGMGRLGVWHEDAKEFIGRLIKRCHHLKVKGLFTHFPVAESDQRFTRSQIKNLDRVVRSMDKEGLVVPFVHAANSMGIADYRSSVLNLARPGLMLYGLYPEERIKRKIRLSPVLSVHSRIMFIKKVPRGRSISYGRTFVARRPMTIATVAVGYRDGYLRCLSNRSSVLVAGRRCPVVGRVTMDQIMIDVSRVARARVGQEVVVLGRQGREEISAGELAKLAGTISYEIVTSLGNRIGRVHR